MVVLVHGAWHTGAELEPVAAPIRAAGHTVYTPTIRGNRPGDAANSFILPAYTVADIFATYETKYQNRPVIYQFNVKNLFDTVYYPSAVNILNVAMGDARLSLERERPENFDVMAVDAFSSDSIPVHLLTKEAMALYFRHLQPDGILAVHISNRYLNLQPVLAGETKALNKVARLVDTEDDEDTDVFGATWVLIASPSTGFSGEELSSSSVLEPKVSVRLWTDDYSNLFKILK